MSLFTPLRMAVYAPGSSVMYNADSSGFEGAKPLAWIRRCRRYQETRASPSCR